MRITSLEPQANNPERINLYVDGHFLLGVNAAIVFQMGLQLEQELLPDQLEQLRNEEALQQAVDRALNYLSFRPRSREEVRRYLRKKETPPELIDTVIQRLDELNLVNDQSFSEFWLESLQSLAHLLGYVGALDREQQRGFEGRDLPLCRCPRDQHLHIRQLEVVNPASDILPERFLPSRIPPSIAS